MLDSAAATEPFDRVSAALDRLRHEQRIHFRWLLGGMLGGFTTLLGEMAAILGAMANGFHWL